MSHSSAPVGRAGGQVRPRSLDTVTACQEAAGDTGGRLTVDPSPVLVRCPWRE